MLCKPTGAPVTKGIKYDPKIYNVWLLWKNAPKEASTLLVDVDGGREGINEGQNA